MEQEQILKLYEEFPKFPNPPNYYKEFVTPQSLQKPNLSQIQVFNKTFKSFGESREFHQTNSDKLKQIQQNLFPQDSSKSQQQQQYLYDISTYKKELIKINRSILKKCFDFLESAARGGEETSYIIKDIQTLAKKFYSLTSYLKVVFKSKQQINKQYGEEIQCLENQIQIMQSQIQKINSIMQ